MDVCAYACASVRAYTRESKVTFSVRNASFFLFLFLSIHKKRNLEAMTTLEDKSLWESQNNDDDIGQDILRLAPDEITNRTRLLENDIKVMKSEIVRLQHEQAAMKERIKDNKEKIKMNKQLPYLVGNVVEVTAYFFLSVLSKDVF